jgi:hypothetical protein
LISPASSGKKERRKEGFFFEKKKQKTFVNFAMTERHFTFPASHKIQKFFGSFFQKTNCFSCLTCYLFDRRLSADIQRSEQPPQLGGMLGVDPACIASSMEPLKALVPEPCDHL